MQTTLPPQPSTTPSIFGMSRTVLAERLAGMGVPPYRADQIYSWVFRKHHRSADGMLNLPSALRDSMDRLCGLETPAVASVHASRDGMTHKFVVSLEDGARVECVSMRTERRLTFCLSSQVGCALKCAFCATGLMGLARNLSAAEIVAQIVVMGDFHGWRDNRFNLVYMGMGEPLANVEAVLESIRIVHDPHGLNLGARRITVSTSGVVPNLRRLAEAGWRVGLALSLHATRDDLRDELVPINKRWPLAELLPAAREYGRRTGRRVTLEYILLADVNDRPEDASRLAAIARDL